LFLFVGGGGGGVGEGVWVIRETGKRKNGDGGVKGG
jgi:hypothetical protein